MRNIAIEGKTYGATNVMKTIVSCDYTMTLTEVKHRKLAKYIVAYRARKQAEVILAIEDTQRAGEVTFEHAKNLHSCLK